MMMKQLVSDFCSRPWARDFGTAFQFSKIIKDGDCWVVTYIYLGNGENRFELPGIPRHFSKRTQWAVHLAMPRASHSLGWQHLG